MHEVDAGKCEFTSSWNSTFWLVCSTLERKCSSWPACDCVVKALFHPWILPVSSIGIGFLSLHLVTSGVILLWRCSTNQRFLELWPPNFTANIWILRSFCCPIAFLKENLTGRGSISPAQCLSVTSFNGAFAVLFAFDCWTSSLGYFFLHLCPINNHHLLTVPVAVLLSFFLPQQPQIVFGCCNSNHLDPKIHYNPL